MPRQWRVTLKDGSVVDLWAGSYGEVDGRYVFDILAEAPPEEQADDQIVVSAQTPSNPLRFMFTVARIPIDLVSSIAMDGWLDE
jgi:hypothetical protein